MTLFQNSFVHFIQVSSRRSRGLASCDMPNAKRAYPPCSGKVLEHSRVYAIAGSVLKRTVTELIVIIDSQYQVALFHTPDNQQPYHWS